MSERELEEKVVDIHLKNGNGPKSVRTGKQYLDKIWPNEDIDITELISHLISWDFPKKYKPLETHYEDIYELEKRIREGKKDKAEILEEKIQRFSKEIQTKVL